MDLQGMRLEPLVIPEFDVEELKDRLSMETVQVNLDISKPIKK